MHLEIVLVWSVRIWISQQEADADDAAAADDDDVGDKLETSSILCQPTAASVNLSSMDNDDGKVKSSPSIGEEQQFDRGEKKTISAKQG